MATELEFLDKLKGYYYEYVGELAWQGSEAEQRLKIMAREFYNLQNQIDSMKKQCSWDTATGSYLGEIATRCGIYRRTGSLASGKIRLYFAPETEDTPINSNYIIVKKNKPHLMYRIINGDDYKKGAGYCDIECNSFDKGPLYNAELFDEFEFINPPKGFIKGVCIRKFESGENEENDEMLRKRIKNAIRYYNSSILSPEKLREYINGIPNVKDCAVYMDTMSVRVYVKGLDKNVEAEVNSYLDEVFYFAKILGCKVEVFTAEAKEYDIRLEYKGEVIADDLKQKCYDFYYSRGIGEYISEGTVLDYLQSEFAALDYLKVTVSDSTPVGINQYNSIGSIEVVKKK